MLSGKLFGDLDVYAVWIYLMAFSNASFTQFYAMWTGFRKINAFVYICNSFYLVLKSLTKEMQFFCMSFQTYMILYVSSNL